jgi:hypothetical protein
MSYGSRRLASQFVLPPHRRSLAKGRRHRPAAGIWVTVSGAGPHVPPVNGVRPLTLIRAATTFRFNEVQP